MNKDQIAENKLKYPEEYEMVVESLYEWPPSGLIHELLRWIPQSEFLKMIHQVQRNENKT